MEDAVDVLIIGQTAADWLFPLARGVVGIGVALLFVLVIWLRFEQLNTVYASDDSETDVRKTNCPACGARISVDSDVCDHCETSVTEESEISTESTPTPERG
ncbi:hypothetical protein GCM10028856_05440 [Halopiger thermotolerans]